MAYERSTNEATMMGGPIALTLFGLVVIGASLFAEKALVPGNTAKAAGVMAVVFVVGVVLGAVWDRVRR